MKNEFTPEQLIESFIKLYGGNKNEVSVFRSPARINIIGEHIDYNGGNVFPATINRYLFVAIRKRTDNKIIYNDVRFPGTYEFSISEKLKYKKENDYANYLNGIVSQFQEKGLLFTSGFEVLIASNIPAGGGISSSSALECGFAWAVSETYGFNLSRTEIALIGQKSEHNFMNVKCGIMDQYVISTGKLNFAEILNCETLECEYVPLDLKDYSFIVMNTNKVRKLSESKYNERKEQCEKALKILQDNGVNIKNLCQLSLKDWETYSSLLKDEVIYKRARHCICENDRVFQASQALKKGDLTLLGKLLNESHNSLKYDYEVTGIELDTLVETARKQNGCSGARMTGAGFGGCAIALVKMENIPEFIENVQAVYEQNIGYKASFFVCHSGDGVTKIN